MSSTETLRTVAVAGTGLMGCGIASLFASAGVQVVIFDSDARARRMAKEKCKAVFDEMVTAGTMTASAAASAEARVATATSLEAFHDAQLVVEAIVESIDAKQSLYAEVEEVLGETAIIASTTSAIVPELLSARLRRPGRFLVAHFWNPPHIIPLVEVVAAPDTDPQVVSAVMDWVKAVNGKPVLLSKAAPGFIGNRLQFAVLREALHMLETGIADAQTIDEVMRQSVGRRYRWIGPLEGADIGGLETFLKIGTQLLPHLASNDEGLDVLRKLVVEKRGGRRDGHGIYIWDADREVRLRESRLQMLKEAHLEGPGPAA